MLPIPVSSLTTSKATLYLKYHRVDEIISLGPQGSFADGCRNSVVVPLVDVGGRDCCTSIPPFLALFERNSFLVAKTRLHVYVLRVQQSPTRIRVWTTTRNKIRTSLFGRRTHAKFTRSWRPDWPSIGRSSFCMNPCFRSRSTRFSFRIVRATAVY